MGFLLHSDPCPAGAGQDATCLWNAASRGIKPHSKGRGTGLDGSGQSRLLTDNSASLQGEQPLASPPLHVLPGLGEEGEAGALHD